jgi:hypothetical protein
VAHANRVGCFSDMRSFGDYTFCGSRKQESEPCFVVVEEPQHTKGF